MIPVLPFSRRSFLGAAGLVVAAGGGPPSASASAAWAQEDNTTTLGAFSHPGLLHSADGVFREDALSVVESVNSPADHGGPAGPCGEHHPRHGPGRRPWLRPQGLVTPTALGQVFLTSFVGPWPDPCVSARVSTCPGLRPGPR